MESTFKHHFNKNYAGKVAGLLITLTKSPGRKRLTQHIDPDKYPVIKLSKNKLVSKYSTNGTSFESLQKRVHI